MRNKDLYKEPKGKLELADTNDCRILRGMTSLFVTKRSSHLKRFDKISNPRIIYDGVDETI